MPSAHSQPWPAGLGAGPTSDSRGDLKSPVLKFLTLLSDPISAAGTVSQGPAAGRVGGELKSLLALHGHFRERGIGHAIGVMAESGLDHVGHDKAGASIVDVIPLVRVELLGQGSPPEAAEFEGSGPLPVQVRLTVAGGVEGSEFRADEFAHGLLVQLGNDEFPGLELAMDDLAMRVMASNVDRMDGSPSPFGVVLVETAPERDEEPVVSASVILDSALRVEARCRGRFALDQEWGVAAGAGVKSPLVSVIVPSYNHAEFLVERLESIYAQTYDNIEVIILDDGSEDDSIRIIESYRSQRPWTTRVQLSEQNSGNVFKQWSAGLSLARGELVWIAESDDVASVDFLERLVPCFKDESVSLAFGDIQYCSANGEHIPGLDSYRSADDVDWTRPWVKSGWELFRGAFGRRNMIVNASGVVMRKRAVSSRALHEASQLQTCGDWLIYAHVAALSYIAYEPDAKAWFRQHGSNSSVNSTLSRSFYQEYVVIGRALRRLYGLRQVELDRLLDEARPTAELRLVDDVEDTWGGLRADMLTLTTEAPSLRILIASLGLTLGGGEIFPINLCNEMHRRGHSVALGVLGDAETDEPEIVRRLVEGIPIHRLRDSSTLQRYCQDLGIDVVSSHNIGVEALFVDEGASFELPPYVVTHHGSYEVSGVPSSFVRALEKWVTHWVYLTPRNLDPLREAGIVVEGRSSRIPNGIPPVSRPGSMTRASLGIPDSDYVCAVVSRALPEKGWQTAIEAVGMLNDSGTMGRPVHLLLAGTGPEFDRLDRVDLPPYVHLLGYADAGDVYQCSDIGLLASTFAGESYPLTALECLHEGRPFVATDVGSVVDLLTDRVGEAAGAVVSLTPEVSLSERFADATERVLARLNDPKLHHAIRDRSEAHSMTKVAQQYEALFLSRLDHRGEGGFDRSLHDLVERAL